MSNESMTMRQTLTDCLEAAKGQGTEIEYEISFAVDMESEVANALVYFQEERTAENSLNVRLLLDQLEEKSTVAAIDLFPPPQTRLVIHGAINNRTYRIVVKL